MKKGLRKQLMNAALTRYDVEHPSESNHHIVYLLHDMALRPEEVGAYICTYLDENCSNGYRSRWTNHGNSISFMADEVADILYALYQEYEA